MEISLKDGARTSVNGEPHSSRIQAACTNAICLLLLACTITLSGCGGSSSSNISLIPPPSLTGNWQFTMSPPTDGSFVGGLQGGFLLQNNGSVSGAATYSVSLTNFSVPCNRGSATVTGTLNGQTVQFTAVAGTQTFTLNGALSLDGSTITGTYDSSAGTAGDGSPCGAAQTGAQWIATLVPPLDGPVQGSFQSGGGAAGLSEQNFAVSGTLAQAENTGASSSIVTGSLTFLNPITNTSPYPCFGAASVYGQISGTSVSLEIMGNGGAEWGLIGEPVGSLGGTGLSMVTLNPVHGGYALGAGGASYLVTTTACPGVLGDISTSGDYGAICLAVNGATACQEPILLTPSGLSFSSQLVGGPPASLSITLTNNSSSILTGVTLALTNDSGAANFTEKDLCGSGGVPSLGEPFNFYPGQFCPVTVTFAPLETCAAGTPPAQCPSPLTAKLMIAIPSNSTIITAPIMGTASGGHAVSIPQVDFGVKYILEANDRQSLNFPGPWRTFDSNSALPEQPRSAGCEGSCRD
jgi:hypothetical protein